MCVSPFCQASRVFVFTSVLVVGLVMKGFFCVSHIGGNLSLSVTNYPGQVQIVGQAFVQPRLCPW